MDFVAFALAILAVVLGLRRLQDEPVSAATLFLCVVVLAVPRAAFALAQRLDSMRLVLLGLAARSLPFLAILVIVVVVAIVRGDAAWFLPLLIGALGAGVLLAVLRFRRRGGHM